MASFLVRVSDSKWYQIISAIFVLAFFLRSGFEWFPNLLPRNFELPPRDYFLLAMLIVLIPGYARLVKDLRAENRGKYNPHDRSIRRLALRDGLISLLFLLGAGFFWCSRYRIRLAILKNYHFGQSPCCL